MKNPEFVQTAPADLRERWRVGYSAAALRRRHAPRRVPASESDAGALILRLLTDPRMRRPWEAMRRAANGRDGWAIRIADAAVGAERHANAMEENRRAGKAAPYKGRAPRAKYLRELAREMRAVADKIGLEGLGGWVTIPESIPPGRRPNADEPPPGRSRRLSLGERILDAASEAERLAEETPHNPALALKPMVKHIRVIEFVRALAPQFHAEFGGVLLAPLAALASVALQAPITRKQVEKLLHAAR